MQSITLIVPPGRESERRIVRFWGERRLHDFADTGVFTISTGAAAAAPNRGLRDSGDDDALADLVIEIDGNLDLADSDRGAHPYERDCYSRRTISP